VAVERQLMSDVEVASYLSGGLDTGAVTAAAARRLKRLTTFATGFDTTGAEGMEAEFDERSDAAELASALGTHHHELLLDSHDLEMVLPRLVQRIEEPRMSFSYPNYLTAGMASRWVKVVLSGVGGDEIFGGYPWRYYRAARNRDFDHYVTQYYDFWQRLVTDDLKPDIFKPIWPAVRHVSTRDIFQDVLAPQRRGQLRPEDYVNCSLYLEARTFLHGLLVVEDKMSMAHSLETRVPFLDNDLVEFATSIPVSEKLGNLAEFARINENDIPWKREQYFRRFRDGKLLLRKMMKNYVPHDIANGEKQGFSGPDGTWFKGESIEYVRRLLQNRNARIYDYLDRQAVQALVDEHLQGIANRRLLIWSLIYLENLMQIFIDQRSSVDQPSMPVLQSRPVGAFVS